MKKENYRYLKIMTWPPQSTDLNPIELVWDCGIGQKSESETTHECRTSLEIAAGKLGKHIG